jgi:hypothetical protein
VLLVLLFGRWQCFVILQHRWQIERIVGVYMNCDKNTEDTQQILMLSGNGNTIISMIGDERDFSVEQQQSPQEEKPDTNHWPKNKVGRARVRKFKEDAICYYCDRRHKKINRFTVDHIEPASRGGKNGDNLVLCCKNCNYDKQDLTPEQYMELCIKRAKRVMYAKDLSLWSKVRLFFKVVKLWVAIGEGIR